MEELHLDDQADRTEFASLKQQNQRQTEKIELLATVTDEHKKTIER